MHTHKHVQIHRCTPAFIHTGGQTDRDRQRQTGNHTGRQADRQTTRTYTQTLPIDIQTYIPTCFLACSQCCSHSFMSWNSQAVQSTFIVECRVSILGITIMIWRSIPPITVPRTPWDCASSEVAAAGPSLRARLCAIGSGFNNPKLPKSKNQSHTEVLCLQLAGIKHYCIYSR